MNFEIDSGLICFPYCNPSLGKSFQLHYVHWFSVESGIKKTAFKVSVCATTLYINVEIPIEFVHLQHPCYL